MKDVLTYLNEFNFELSNCYKKCFRESPFGWSICNDTSFSNEVTTHKSRVQYLVF